MDLLIKSNKARLGELDLKVDGFSEAIAKAEDSLTQKYEKSKDFLETLQRRAAEISLDLQKSK